MKTTSNDFPLNRERQIKYFLRCLKTCLPAAYTSTDSNRMTLAFFVLASLDLLGALETSVSDTERSQYISWIYGCQLPTGGFRGSPGTDFSHEYPLTGENAVWDPANLPATFFALVALLLLKDDLSKVRRTECLTWLRKLQRPDGSFGEVLGTNERIEGCVDLRFCCCASGIRYILRGKDELYLKNIEDIDTVSLERYISNCQTLMSLLAGLTYCAIGALHFLNKLTPKPEGKSAVTDTFVTLPEDSQRFEHLIEWLGNRQTTVLEESEDSRNGSESEEPATIAEERTCDSRSQACAQSSNWDDRIRSLPYLSPSSKSDQEDLKWAGFNGRQNKIADTCYCFWVTASLTMLHRLNVIDLPLMGRFLTEGTQHVIGGFGKALGEVPDILHSCLGLMALAIAGQCGLPPVDPALCTRKRVVEHLESLSWWSGKGEEISDA
ncbi:hypothetical protein KEM54_003474 [Ascosphaera aggregata]|nr:hypothetical protein KEM54_003474 [Ascosphaera aggregata]